MSVKEQELLDMDLDIENPYTIMLHNDDYNTFEHVILCLTKHCGHTPEQAEQCAYIVHFKGICDVKRGQKEELEKIYRKLQNAKLTVTLED